MVLGQSATGVASYKAAYAAKGSGGTSRGFATPIARYRGDPVQLLPLRKVMSEVVGQVVNLPGQITNLPHVITFLRVNKRVNGNLAPKRPPAGMSAGHFSTPGFDFNSVCDNNSSEAFRRTLRCEGLSMLCGGRWHWLGIVVAMVPMAAWWAAKPEASARELAAPFARRLPARPFPAGLPWINTARPVVLSELRGRFVLLDFWTLGCINCMHIIPELHKLERAWPNELVVIGVHSAKFEREKQTKSIAAAVLRYRVEHPVVNDSDFAIWNSYGVRSWPSLVLIDPEGYAVWAHSGEATFEQLNALLKRAEPYYRAKRLLDRTPLRFGVESAKTAQTPLRFPGKVLADEPGGRLFVADSGHNRIVIARLDGSLLATIGSGQIGRADGDYATAEFNTPQGMAIDGQSLYVADTENHLIRKVDLAARRVTTVAGVGRQGRDTPSYGAPAKAAGLGAKQSLGIVSPPRRPLHRHGGSPSNMDHEA